MSTKGGVLNKGSEHVTIRTSKLPPRLHAEPGSLSDDRQYPVDRFGNRLPDDLPATYYKRRGLNAPPPFTYKYAREDEREVLSEVSEGGGVICVEVNSLIMFLIY